MKIKILISIILVMVLTFVAVVIYSRTTEGQYGLLLKNVLNHIEHVTKARDNGVAMNEVISWYKVAELKKSNPVHYHCIIKGIRYVYSRRELTPEEIRTSYKRQIEVKKDYWIKRIKNRTKD
jgi:hypothetical protein